MTQPKGFFVDPPQVTTDATGKHFIEHCGCCESYHPHKYDGDCRADANRYGDEQEYAERNHIKVTDVVIVAEEED